jgi:hypothetical protein
MPCVRHCSTLPIFHVGEIKHCFDTALNRSDSSVVFTAIRLAVLTQRTHQARHLFHVRLALSGQPEIALKLFDFLVIFIFFNDIHHEVPLFFFIHHLL